MLLKVRDWDKHFENNRTRQMPLMRWVPVPNKHDGDGLTVLLDHDDAAAHYGAWHMILQVASKCHPRGTLVRENGKPHDARSLSRLTHISAEIFAAVIPRLVDDEIGWLEVLAMEHEAQPCHDHDTDVAQPCHDHDTEGKGIEEKGTEQKKVLVPDPPEGTPVHTPVVSQLDSLNMKERHPTKNSFRYWGKRENGIVFDRVTVSFIGITDQHLQVWIDAYPAVDVGLAIKQAAAWVSTNKDGKGCKQDYHAFLNNWLARAQAKGGNRGRSDAVGTGGRSTLPSEKDIPK